MPASDRQTELLFAPDYDAIITVIIVYVNNIVKFGVFCCIHMQEIPFRHIWNGSQSGLHCSFTLEHIEPQSSQLSCDVIVSQTLLPGNRQIIPLVYDVNAPATHSPQVIGQLN